MLAEIESLAAFDMMVILDQVERSNCVCFEFDLQEDRHRSRVSVKTMRIFNNGAKIPWQLLGWRKSSHNFFATVQSSDIVW